MPKVSVIIPVYGVEKYIERCARSLFEQTLDDIEYLFIDDCTPDRSIEILNRVLDEYPQRKNQVIIHRMEKNSGQAAVRKWGMLNATGDYVIHCDSDDWVDVTMYEKMYNHAIQHNSDLVICDYIISNGNKDSEKIFKKNITDCSREAVFQRLLTTSVLNPVWSAMAKRELYDEMMFPVGAMSEDKTIMIQLAWKANNITYLPEALYFYFLSETSILRTINKEANIRKFRQITDNRYILLNFFEKEKIQVPQKQLDAFVFAGKMGLIESFLDDPKCKRLWEATFPLSRWSVLLNPYIHIKSRIKYFIIKWK